MSEHRFFSDIFRDAFHDPKKAATFSDVTVRRVTINSARDHLCIYIDSPHLIHHRVIEETERSVADSLLGGLGVRVNIVERYSLSGQYTARNLYPLYQDSLLYELKSYSPMLYTLMRQADAEFEADDTLTLTVEDNCVQEEVRKELQRVLEKVFCERCGQDLKIHMVVTEGDESESENLRLAASSVEREISRITASISNGEADPDADADGAGDELLGAEAGANTAQGAGTPEDGAGDDVRIVLSDPTAGKKKREAARERSAAGGRRHTARGRRSGKDAAEHAVRSLRRSDRDDVLYGRDFEGETIPLEQLVDEGGTVIVHGRIEAMDFRAIRGERTIVMIDMTDYTDSIRAKLFVDNENLDELRSLISVGMFVRLKGTASVDAFDHELAISSVSGIMRAADFRETRMDDWPEKRVELHCHTKMSDMDGVSDVKDLIETAMRWGHEALAVTDHGVVQAFPDANHAVPKGSDFKVIYGCEGYLVDDLKEVAVNEQGQALEGDCVVFDLETTGFSPVKNKIIEIGAVYLKNGVITDRFSTFVNPQEPIPYRIEQLTSIRDDMVMNSPTIEEILPKFMEFVGDAVLVAHNAGFDVSFIRTNCERQGIGFHHTSVDTVAMARILLPQLGRFKLDNVAKALNVPLGHHHRAVDDAECTAGIYQELLKMLQDRDIHTLAGLNELGHSSHDQVKKMPMYHVILLATNDVGRVNLYRLVSLSHLKYFSRRPRIPKSELMRLREGLLIGSACEAGELFRAIVRGASDQELTELASFYDYLEIQPIANNEFMTRDDYEDRKTIEELRDFNRRIVELGEQTGRPVVATGDVHFLNPEDGLYRKIILSGIQYKDADEQPPLYLRTTEEMLKEFEYLGEEKAREVVITNTVKIARMCEKISPVRPDKCPPVIENSDQILRNLCYSKAHEIYGEELPEIVSARLSRELDSIIGNGFAVMYIIAQKLVWKSVADGYLVGSRGSVGSSFVATMAGITEVNPLHPHYICPKCHYSDFDSEEVRRYDGMAGCDMPDKLCPNCGTPLRKDGFDIPFETFLGFKGNKEPDIDLNFSGEYQSKAHKYTEVIFGAGQTFRAGTIGTLADKTAYGYVKHYFEDRGISKRSAEINRIVQGCVGVRRTTGQHPGGIIVLPYGEDICSFTPVQHPANDQTTDIVTTHFDYHSIDHNLLKLDILGHDDPTMVRMLQDLTGIDPVKVPLDAPEVMSLFQSTEAIGVTPEQIGTPLGSLGIPEFGTEFAMQMLIDTKPKYFSDLVRIAGLAHGTDVWLGNAQTLIQEGKATISTAICTRDDIMIYLIEKGLDSEQAFTIMESVRKGKGLKDEWEKEMVEHGVPDWYIWSCKKIKYMFPKAHAAAYVMMAWRIAWFKIHEPLAYYAAFFSIRAPGFDYEMMCQGKERMYRHMEDFEKRKDDLQKKEEAQYRDMKVVREMYERGFNFMPIDLSKVKATRFQVIDGKLMPSLSSINGLGEKAAQAIVDAVVDGEFISKDDFRERTHVSKTVVDQLSALGILTGLPESNQLSLFDL